MSHLSSSQKRKYAKRDLRDDRPIKTDRQNNDKEIVTIVLENIDLINSLHKGASARSKKRQGHGGQGVDVLDIKDTYADVATQLSGIVNKHISTSQLESAMRVIEYPAAVQNILRGYGSLSMNSDLINSPGILRQNAPELVPHGDCPMYDENFNFVPYIYFITEKEIFLDPIVKIGYTFGLFARLLRHHTQAWRPLRIIGFIRADDIDIEKILGVEIESNADGEKDPRDVESALKRKFSMYRAYNKKEFFHCNPVTIREMERMLGYKLPEATATTYLDKPNRDKTLDEQSKLIAENERLKKERKRQLFEDFLNKKI